MKKISQVFLDTFGDKRATAPIFPREDLIYFLENNQNLLSPEGKIFFEQILSQYDYDYIPTMSELYETLTPLLEDMKKDDILDVLLPGFFLWVFELYMQKSISEYEIKAFLGEPR